MTPVLVTGMGIVSAAGRGLDATARALREGRSGLGPLTRFASPRCGHVPVAECSSAECPGTDDRPRTLALALAALQEAIASAGLTAGDLAGCGLALGTCVAGMPETEAAVAGWLGAPEDSGPDPRTAEVLGRHECGFTAHALAEALGIRGPVTTLSSACSSAAQAIATGFDLLQAGVVDTVIAGGSDALCRLTLNGFSSLLNVSPEGCRPFDAARDGMSLGEGAAFLVLRAGAPGGAGFARLAGHGNTCDAHHPTAPHPDGVGAEGAMRRALRMAAIEPRDVDYVNAHGTGTVENDRAEGRALRRLFGERDLAFSSTKRVFGHTLGAAGAVEAVATVLAIRDGFVPGNPGFATPDPECAVEPVRTTRDQPVRIALSNSLGFGGNNSALCFAGLAG